MPEGIEHRAELPQDLEPVGEPGDVDALEDLERNYEQAVRDYDELARMGLHRTRSDDGLRWCDTIEARYLTQRLESLQREIARVQEYGLVGDWKKLMLRKARLAAGAAGRDGKPKRPCYERDHEWLRLNREQGLTPAKLRDLWNKEHPHDPVERETVKKALLKAKAEENGSER
ncbi:MAG TPA: hypothetical protein VHC22_28225 [Pirellulales bacterium]|nr:hypothetical protein [Pirellulales bacterium]